MFVEKKYITIRKGRTEYGLSQRLQTQREREERIMEETEDIRSKGFNFSYICKSVQSGKFGNRL